jgi:putative transposase
MTQLQSLAHTKWACKYNLVWIPKYRKQTLFGNLRRELGPVLRELAQHRESEILEGHMMSDHVHVLISIPPSMRCRKWWATSRAPKGYPVRSILPAPIWDAGDIPIIHLWHRHTLKLGSKNG